MRRSLGAVVATAAAAAVLTACGGDSPYCATIRDTEGQLRAIGNAATDADLATAAGAAQRIADVAPEPVDGDWRGIATALTSFAETLRTVGITYQDLLAQQNLQDLTDDDRAKLTASARAAAQGQQQHRDDPDQRPGTGRVRHRHPPVLTWGVAVEGHLAAARRTRLGSYPTRRSARPHDPTR